MALLPSTVTLRLSPTIQNLLVIDSQVSNWQDLVAAATPDTMVLMLDPATDGLTQISAYLDSLMTAGAQSYTPLQSIQIISHGSAGSISLGSTSITNSNLEQYTAQLATIGSALTATGDILLYGCNVAAEQIGLDFINQIAALTSADVAASTDLTGATALGGNWQLEVSTGTIDTAVAISTNALTTYTGSLSVTGGSANSVISINNNAAELYMSAYDSTSKNTYSFNTGITLATLLSNKSNMGYSATFDLGTDTNWTTSFLGFAGFNAATTTYGLLVGSQLGPDVFSTSSAVGGLPTAPNDSDVQSIAASIKIHAQEITTNMVGNSHVVNDGGTPETGQFNNFNTFFGQQGDPSAMVAGLYGTTLGFYHLGTVINEAQDAYIGSVTPFVGEWTLSGNTLNYGALLPINHPPTGSVTISGTAGLGQVLTVTNTLADVDGMGVVAYQWLAGGTAISGATTPNFTLTQAQVDKAITVTARYTDQLNHPENVSSNPTAVVTDNTFNVTENVTFWKTGAALSGATSSLVATNTTPPVEFRSLQIAADGSRSFEIWETSTGTDSLQLKIALPNGAMGTWQDAAGLPNGWSSLTNTEISGQLGLAGYGLTALADGPVKLGTLTIHSPNPFTSFDLSLITGSLGTQVVAPFSITPDITNQSSNGLYQHIDIAGGSYQLNTAKSALSIGNAIQANDALATLKMAVGLTPNIDSSAASPFQFLAADVNRDGKVSAADALNVLKMALDLSTAPEKNWFFMPDVVASESMTRTTVNWSGTVNPLTVDHTQTVHLIGVVSGDVNGSWVEPVIA